MNKEGAIEKLGMVQQPDIVPKGFQSAKEVTSGRFSPTATKNMHGPEITEHGNFPGSVLRQAKLPETTSDDGFDQRR
ncbi:hypothetical protein V6N13_011913 [Hibiscus sabdariffa]|uniref:Uncharacterized protein n=1 Tax=Hibiscus sabdariffa TaxID=183260 RepID=A0ABR2SDM6_9ROSI